MGGLRISTLGGLSIELDGRPVTGFASAKAAALLVYLACNPYLHPREVLAELLWNERTQQRAQGNLRVVLASLRKEAGAFVDVTRQTATLKDDGDVWLDAGELERALAQFRQQATAQTVQELVRALALYRGDFLQGYSLSDARGWETWVVTARERYHGLAVEGFEQLAAWCLAEGDVIQAVAVARRLLEIDPLSEAGYLLLMEGLARAGRRGEALAHFERGRQLLWEELGLEPSSATQRLADAIQQGRLELRPSAEPVVRTSNPNDLPLPATPLIGRDLELSAVVTLLADSARLVSIVAPGGMGKTRLALEVAQTQSTTFRDGAVFVDLTPVSTVEGVSPAVAQGLGLQLEGYGGNAPKAQLLNHLRHKAMLLVLDNFEHLLEAGPLLTEIIEAAPGVRLLVTSREALKLHAEHAHPLPGLSFSQWATVEEAEMDSAVQLFLHHARRNRPSFRLHAADLEALQALLQLVEGMPLAIILAAAWVEVLRPAEIVAETSKSLDFLETMYGDLPPRQRSMRAVFHTTWVRLSEEEQAVFAALSVFRGGFTLEAAREVAQATPQELLRLVHRSLLLRREGGRFMVHELLRQFAGEMLASTPDVEEVVRERHSVYYCRFLHEREGVYKSARAAEAAAEITVEFENALSAWHWAADKGRLFQLEQAIILGFYCAGEGRSAAAAEIFQRAVDRFTPTTSAPELRVQGMLLAGLGTFIDMTAAPISRRKEIHQEALARLAVAATLGEDVRYEEAFTLSILAQELTANEPSEARAALERSLSLFQEIGRIYEMAAVTGILASTYVREGDYARAHDCQLKAVQLWEMVGSLQFLYRAKFQLARIKTDMGQRAEGVAAMREVIALLKHAGKSYTAVQGETDLGTALLFFGQFEEAQALLESSMVFLTRLGESLNVDLIRGHWCHVRLHGGNFREVWQEVQRVRDSHRAIEDASTVAIMEWLQGCAAIALGLPQEAVALLKASIEGSRAVKQPEELSWALAASVYVALLEGDLVAARRQALEAVNLARELRVLTSASMALPAVALLLAETGDLKRAVEVYELACQDPFVVNSRWFEAVVGRRLAAVAETLPAEVVQAARERGAGLDLWETVDRLVEELGEL